MRRQRDEQGASAVEFALVLPLLLALLLGVVAVGQGIHTRTTLDVAAREAVRALALDETVDGDDAVHEAVAAAAPGLDQDKLVVSVAGCADGRTDASVQIGYPITLFSWTPSDEITVRAAGVMRCVNA